MSRQDDTPPGLTLSSARRVVTEHRNKADCRHCAPRRCWALESAVRIWILNSPLPAAGSVDRELLTVGAQRVVGSHWPGPGGDGECPVCWVVDCDPPAVAHAYLDAIGSPYVPAPRETTGDGPVSPTRRICVELTPMAAEAYERLPGRDRTDAVCRALRLADVVENWITDGKVGGGPVGRRHDRDSRPVGSSTSS